MTDKERALRHLGITMRGYRTEYGTPILTDVSVKDAIAGVVAAVRAETLREVRGVIADVKAGGEDFADNADEKFGWDQACDCVHNSLALKDTLDALAQPEGSDQ
jgi:hypothetical protein